MSVIFNPSGHLNVSMDASDLPEQGDGINIQSGAMVRCKNLRINQAGLAKTRDGSAKLNSTAINTAVWWVEVQDGVRYAFAGTNIYEDETSIASGLTSAQWSAIQYNAYNDTTDNIFALNGTDRKRIESSVAYEWGIAAPTDVPVIAAGDATTDLSGRYNVKVTYLRKVGSVVVSESNPGPAASSWLSISGNSLTVSVDTPSDTQVTHIRLYRTTGDGVIYYRDQDIPVNTYAYGYSEDFEASDAYISGDGFKFTLTDSTHGTENTYSWEATAETQEDTDSGGSSNNWWEEDTDLYNQYLLLLQAMGGGFP